MARVGDARAPSEKPLRPGERSPDQQPAEVAIRVPIEFRHVPQGLEISSATIPEAQIRVRGPERLIRDLRSTDLHAELELADAQAGERTFDLTAQQIRHQRELNVVQVVPGQVHLSFDTRLIRADVEIHPRVTGVFVAGEQIAKVLVDPERITITGPRHHVEMLDAATTDEMVEEVEATLLGDGTVENDDVLVIISGAPMWVTGTTNLLKLHRVGDRR